MTREVLIEHPLSRELRDRRSIEQACADLRANYERRPTRQLARMIEQLQAEIAIRKTQLR